MITVYLKTHVSFWDENEEERKVYALDSQDIQYLEHYVIISYKRKKKKKTRKFVIPRSNIGYIEINE